jgi:plastocyanin
VLTLVYSRARRLALLLLFPVGWPLCAQVTVNGQVTIQERPGVRTTDLANAVIWLEPMTASSPRIAPTPNAQIAMEDRQFTPGIRVVAVGSTINFPNHDPFRHNVFSKAGPGEFDLGLYGRGESKGAHFDRPGIYPVFCNIHARMVAFVVAVPTPWVTQAGADGHYSLAGIPTGKYSLHAWHDRGGELQRELTVSTDSPLDANLALDARQYRVVPHKNKFGQEYTKTGSERY